RRAATPAATRMPAAHTPSTTTSHDGRRKLAAAADRAGVGGATGSTAGTATTAEAGGAGVAAGGSGSTTITGCTTGAEAAEAVGAAGGVAAGVGSGLAGRQRTGIVTSGGVSSLTSTKSHSAWARAGRFAHRPTAHP